MFEIPDLEDVIYRPGMKPPVMHGWTVRELCPWCRRQSTRVETAENKPELDFDWRFCSDKCREEQAAWMKEQEKEYPIRMRRGPRTVSGGLPSLGRRR